MPHATIPPPRLIAWEITRRCNLHCAHCRADADERQYRNELSTAECLDLVDQIAGLGRPILIMTGGEPLLRSDLFDVIARARQHDLRVVMSPNGTLVDAGAAGQMRQAGIERISVSLDFPDAARHDRFRGSPGAFEGALRGIRQAQAAGIKVQVNTTITRLNVDCLDEMLQLAMDLGAVAFHPFLLVPTGRGKGLSEQELAPADYERTLQWIFERQRSLGERIFFKPTDAPHYMRVLCQRGAGRPSHPHQAHLGAGEAGLNALSRGCLAGTGFLFISHMGEVQGCGYLAVSAGTVRRQPLAQIWQESPLFLDLRRFDQLKGKCGRCEYRRICGGCRARAYEATGDYMAEEPYCIYQPHGGLVECLSTGGEAG